MLNAIVKFSLQFRVVVLALSLALLCYGIYSLSHSKYDVFPEFAPPQIDVQTEAPGLAPEQVEVQVTQPIENALNGVSGIQIIRSGSIQGLSVITVTLQPESDIYRDRQAIAERLSTISGQLPQGVQPPVMSPMTSSTGDLMTIGLTSDKLSLMDIRTIADWTVKRRLLAVAGVAKVGVFGGEVRQIQIQLLPKKLIQYDLSIEDVLAAARRATGVRGGGFIDSPNQRIVIQTEGQSITADVLSKTALLHQAAGLVNESVTLGDVAKVVAAPEPRISAGAVMGKPGVVLNVWAQLGANTLETTREVEIALDELRPALEAQGVTMTPNLFRAANFIEVAVKNVKTSLIIGAVLIVVVLLLFLFNFRTAAISCTAIPLSLLGAIAVLEYLGFTLNTMTLGGLAIAIGEVVDDAVIDVENILRRLRENKGLAEPRPILKVVLDASIEVRSAVVYATFMVALVFIPVLTMSGVAGRLFAPLGVAYIAAILTSLLVALTVTPALCLVLLKNQKLREGEPPVVRWLKERYHRLLQRVERQFKYVILAVAIVTLAGIGVLPFMSGGFLPELHEGHFIIHISAVPGTSLDETLRIGQRVNDALLKLPFVRSVAQRVGRASSDDIFGTHSGELEVDLKPLKGDEPETAQGDIRKTLEQFPGVNFVVNTFLTERIEETLSGYTSSVVVNIIGNDLDVLDTKAHEVMAVLEKVSGAAEVQIQSPPGTPQLIISLRKDELSRWGFEPVDVLEAVRTAYEGDTVSQVYEGNRVVDVSVILDPVMRRSIGQVGQLPLRSPTGSYVRLDEIAEIRESSGRYVVLHEGTRRVQTVTCNVVGRDVGSFVNDAKEQIQATVPFADGMYTQFGGTAVAQARSRQDLLVHSLLVGLGIMLLLFIAMGNMRNLVLLLINVPFALVGGVMVIFASGGALTIGSLVGFVTLFGITLRNSIMMLSHYKHLVSTEGAVWGEEVAIRGASERLAPILMTALVTSLGLLPLALGSGAPGREIEGPMAMVILGGLVTSTLLNLLVLPTLALRYGRFEKQDHELE